MHVLSAVRHDCGHETRRRSVVWHALEPTNGVGLMKINDPAAAARY